MRLGFFRKLTSGFALGANLVVILLFLLSCLTPHLDPARWWFTGFLGLLFPFLLAALLGFFLFWLFIRPRKSLFSLAALLIGFQNISTTLALRQPSPFPVKKDSSHLRIMSWNIRYFVPFEIAKFKSDAETSIPDLLEEIRTYQPDIICFQEFFNNGEDKGKDAIEIFSHEMGYPFVYFSRDQIHWRTLVSGTAIFSKYPIVRSSKISFPDDISEGMESTLIAEIAKGTDTFRVATFHLQSFRFMPRDYQGFGKIKAQQDTGLSESRKIFRKMRNTFYLHGKQSDYILSNIPGSPYPLVLTGDLNDVPNSYAYLTMRGNLKDAFLEKGSGIGKTYTSPNSRFLGKLPTLRIDYIFADPGFEVMGFHRIVKPISDHYGLVADLKFPKKG